MKRWIHASDNAYRVIDRNSTPFRQYLIVLVDKQDNIVGYYGSNYKLEFHPELGECLIFLGDLFISYAKVYDTEEQALRKVKKLNKTLKNDLGFLAVTYNRDDDWSSIYINPDAYDVDSAIVRDIIQGPDYRGSHNPDDYSIEIVELA